MLVESVGRDESFRDLFDDDHSSIEPYMDDDDMIHQNTSKLPGLRPHMRKPLDTTRQEHQSQQTEDEPTKSLDDSSSDLYDFGLPLGLDLQRRNPEFQTSFDGEQSLSSICKNGEEAGNNNNSINTPDPQKDPFSAGGVLSIKMMMVKSEPPVYNRSRSNSIESAEQHNSLRYNNSHDGGDQSLANSSVTAEQHAFDLEEHLFGENNENKPDNDLKKEDNDDDSSSSSSSTTSSSSSSSTASSISQDTHEEDFSRPGAQAVQQSTSAVRPGEDRPDVREEERPGFARAAPERRGMPIGSRSFRRRTLLSCLKSPSNSSARRLMALSGEGGRRSRQVKKQVRFHTVDQDLWCLTQEFTPIARRDRKDVWFSRQEIHTFVTHDEELHQELVESDYRPTLERAYVSVQHQGLFVEDVDFDFASYCLCNGARGMEQRAAATMFSAIVQTHRRAVLKLQSIWREQSLVGVEDDDGPELLRMRSQKYSRPVALMAQKMAMWDAKVVGRSK